MGYHRAGFEVVGVDIKPQPHYPFPVLQRDAIAFLKGIINRTGAAAGYSLGDFDAIHASPPCQRYSIATHVQGNRERHPDLVASVREILNKCEIPWIIENVYGAPLQFPIMLCGTMFNLHVFRHRYFELSFGMMGPIHHKHNGTCMSHRWHGKHYDDLSGGYITVCGGGNCRIATARMAMGIDWMTKYELNQAIPPAYTEYIGRQLMRAL